MDVEHMYKGRSLATYSLSLLIFIIHAKSMNWINCWINDTKNAYSEMSKSRTLISIRALSIC